MACPALHHLHPLEQYLRPKITDQLTMYHYTVTIFVLSKFSHPDSNLTDWPELVLSKILLVFYIDNKDSGDHLRMADC